MLSKKYFLTPLLLNTLFLFNTSPAFSEIIFQDNFDNSPDWSSQQTIKKSQPGGYDIAFPMTRADKCTTHCPPRGWSSYRTASSAWEDDRRKDTYILDSAGARGNSGKGISYNVEVTGGIHWVGGSLDVWLGEKGYNELYIRYYLRYSSNWKWTNPAANQHCQQKLIRISTFNDDIWASKYNPQEYGSGSVNWPVLIPDYYYNASYPPTYILQSLRFAPDYSTGDANISDSEWPDDGDWHCYEFHVKTNSAPGVADGVWGFYLDGTLRQEATNVVWKKAGSNTTHNWNWLMFLDNAINASAPITDHVEMTYYMDDVVVSTEYIGLAPDDPLTSIQIYLAPPSF